MRKNIIVHLKGGNYANFYHSKGPIFRRLIKYTVNNANVILVLGELLKDNFSFVKHQGKIKVLHNTAPEFCDDRIRGCKKLNSPIKLLYLSNITPSKGIFDLIDACELLVADGIDFELHIAGDFILNSDCNNIRDNKHLQQLFLSRIKEFQNHIFYHGIADKNLKYKLLENCHVFVLPTYYNNEGQPIAIIESLYFGLAVISTKYRGIPEMLHAGENGYFVKPSCPQDIVDKIGKMVCDYALFEKFSKYSIDLYHKHFTRHRHLGGIKKVLWRTSC